MLTILCCLYQGVDVPEHSKGIFTPAWVDKLYRGIKRNYPKDFRFVCLVDDEYSFQEPVEAIPYQNPWRNMWCLLECLRPDVVGDRNLFMGLDTIITGDISEIASYAGEFAMTRDPYHPKRSCSGVMAYTKQAATRIWNQFLIDQNKGAFKLLGEVSDMIWLDENIGRRDHLTDLYPRQIASYKVEIQPGRIKWEDTRIIYFHGIPKPHELLDDERVQAVWV